MIWPSPVIRIHLITALLLPDTLWMFRIWQCYVESWTENCFWHDQIKQRLAIRIHMTIFTLCTTIFTPVDIFITQNSVDHCEWERTPQWIWDRASQNCDFLFCYWCCCCVEYIAIECVYVKTRFECLQKYIAIRWMAAYGSMRKRQLEAFVFIWFAYVHAFEKKSRTESRPYYYRVVCMIGARNARNRLRNANNFLPRFSTDERMVASHAHYRNLVAFFVLISMRHELEFGRSYGLYIHFTCHVQCVCYERNQLPQDSLNFIHTDWVWDKENAPNSTPREMKSNGI